MKILEEHQPKDNYNNQGQGTPQQHTLNHPSQLKEEEVKNVHDVQNISPENKQKEKRLKPQSKQYFDVLVIPNESDEEEVKHLLQKELTEDEKLLIGGLINVQRRDPVTLGNEKWATRVQVLGWSKETFDRVLKSFNDKQEQIGSMIRLRKSKQ